jgi:nitrite reductase (NADH) small subunit
MVGSLALLPPDTVREVSAGGHVLALCNSAGAITALEGVCPHHGGPLGHGAINEEGRVVCPWHLWEFDCVTGEYGDSSESRLATYEIAIHGDDIYVKVP